MADAAAAMPTGELVMPVATQHGYVVRGAPAWAYLLGVTLGGIASLVAVLAAARGHAGEIAGSPAFWTFLGLVVIGELRPILTGRRADPAGVAISTMFSFAALLVFGLPVAVLLQAVATLITGIAQRDAWWRNGFNLGQHTLSLVGAWWVLSLGHVTGLPSGAAPPQPRDLPVLAVAAVVYFALNNGLVWIAQALLRGRSLVETVREDLHFQFLVHITLVGLSPVVAIVAAYRWPLLPLFLLPLIAVRNSAVGAMERTRQATRDTLTGLANRATLVSQTDRALLDTSDGSAMCAVFILDFDRFKEVNDTLGHHVGDQLLQMAGERLESTVRPGDLVARLGADEYAVLLSQVRDGAAARETAERIRATLEAPFFVGETQIDLEASIGIAFGPTHGTDAEVLLQRADIAMDNAKSARTGVETYAVERDLNSPDRLGLLGALRRAVDEGELELHYQPKVHVHDGSVAGVEALVRWRHPTRGLVLPDEFIPLAEQSGLMQRLTDTIIDAALSQVAAWTALGMRVPVAVNVSMRDLQDRGFASRLATQLARHDVHPELVILEITERVLMADVAGASATMTDLDEIGVRISLDDFGTGYSSLVMLKRLPVQEIKVDRSFVKRLGEETGAEDDHTIVRSIIDLGHSLGLSVVAEGVETRESMERLRAFGCDRAQGWFMSPALPPDEMVAWLEARHCPTLRLAEAQ